LILDELVMAISIPPFLTNRRLVILDHPLAAFPKEQGHKRLLDLLSNVPATTALVLVEHISLTNPKMRHIGEIHWLEKWALDSPDRVYVKEYKLPGGGGMAGWVQKRARESGGEFSGPAAEKLLSQAGDDVRVLDLEIQKLLTYVGDRQSVTEEDVLKLTPYSKDGDIFELVDAIGNKDRSRAERVYHRLLKDEDPAGIFGMVVRQFRLLLLGKEILTNRGAERDLIKILNIKPFVGRKIASQAGRFRLADLEWIYHRLLEIDLSAKSSDMDVDLGVDLLIVELIS
jgi:DNA polymerase-3 subunit delta